MPPATARGGIDFIKIAETEDLFPQMQLRTASGLRLWKARFGCSPLICNLVWGILWLQGLQPQGTRTVHLLWTLYFLKTYGTKTVCASFLGCTEKTLRGYVWPLARAISELSVVSKQTNSSQGQGDAANLTFLSLFLFQLIDTLGGSAYR
jgi:hypothetical protein